jgi:hypothetical protein
VYNSPTTAVSEGHVHWPEASAAAIDTRRKRSILREKKKKEKKKNRSRHNNSDSVHISSPLLEYITSDKIAWHTA